MKTKTIGLCVIIKDDSELKGLKKLIKSCGKYVNEFYVTGNNEPQEKIKAFCKDSGVHYSFKKWNKNFAEMRNFNFSQNKCDYGFWADADDTIVGAKNLPALVKDMEERGINLVYMNYDYSKCADLGQADHLRPRLYKNDGKFYWEKSVHETLNHPDEVSISTDLVYVSHEYDFQTKFEKEKRNYDILRAEYEKDKDKTDPRTLHNLGKSSYGLAMESSNRDEMLEQAIFFYNEHIKKSGWDEETYKSYVGIGYCLSILGRHDQAINALLKATEIRPDWDEAYWLLSNCFIDEQNYMKAVEFGEIAMIKKEPNTPLAINKALRRFIGPANLINAYILTNQVAKASKLFNSVNDRTEKFKTLGKIVQDAWELDDYVNKTIDTILYAQKYDKKNISNLVENLPDFIMQDVRIQELRIEHSKVRNWDKKSIVIMCGNSLEDWADPSIIKGIGGSETAVIHFGREAVKLGYDVTVFNRCGNLKGDYKGVHYRPYWEFNPKDSFNWLISWRNPDLCEYVTAKQLWLWNHDKVDDFDEKIIEKVDKFVFLSKWQKEQTNVPDEKCFITSNGVDVSSLPDVGKKDLNKIIYASSPDRGLETILRRWKDIKIALPKAELYPFYGWDNYLKMQGETEWYKEMVKLLDQDGIHEFKRIGQKQLMKEFAEANVWFYPTSFWEINCITGLQAQMLGTIPVTTDYAALNETVHYGVKIRGVKEVFKMSKSVEDKLVSSLIHVMKGENIPDREKMMKDIREKYSWKKITSDWINEYEKN